MSTRRDVKTGFKKGPTSQDKRRRDALKRQKEARSDHLRQARSMLTGGPSQEELTETDSQPLPTPETWQFGAAATIPPTVTPVPLDGQQTKEKKSSNRGNRVRERRRYWACQVSTPEWMTEIPNDLNGAGSLIGSGWFVRPRPEGRRCMVVANDGKTWSRQLDGNILHRWQSSLPFGSPATNRGHTSHSDNSNDFVLLDCVFDDATSTYWVLDGMSWKQTSLYDSTAEFRLYWLYQQLLEVCPVVEPHHGAMGGGGRLNEYPLQMCPYYDCTPEGLRMAYEGEQPFLRDGLLFYLKEGMYEPGSSPLVLQWKDTFSSRYLLYSTHQQAVLQVGEAVDSFSSENSGDSNSAEHPSMETSSSSDISADLSLQTLEGIRVGSVPTDFALTNQISVGDLLKFDIDGVEEVEVEVGSVSTSTIGYILRNPVFQGKCSPNRALADSWSKLVFHYRTRTAPEPTINQLLECCQSVVP